MTKRFSRRRVVETWVPTEEAAIKFCELHDATKYDRSKSGKGFIIFRDVKGTYNENEIPAS
jgi:hypothetical protein